MTLVLAFLRPYALKLAALGLAVLAVLAALAAVRRSGRLAERADTIARNGRILREQAKADARRPADRDDLRKRLFDGSF